MGAYSVVLPDSKILDRVAGFKSVVILFCKNCANLSIAYDKGVPVSRILTNEETGETTQEPVAIIEETKRLQALIKSKGVNARVEVWPGGPCFLNADNESDYMELADRCTGAEAVVALCCVGGIPGPKRYLGKTAKIIPGMRTVGHFHFYRFVDEDFVHIDKSKSRVFRMGKA